jgi:UDP-glucuronate 4-epimerase
MKLLITGGAGFIGSSLSEKLLSIGFTITAVDNFNSYYNPHFKRENIAPFLNNSNYSLVEGDIADNQFLKAIFNKQKFDKVIHLAASVGVRNSLKHSDEYIRNNVLATENILKAAGKNSVKQLIFASSSSVYGNESATPFKEDKITVSKLNPYAQTKKDCEELCFTYHKKYGLPITAFRFFTVYGPKGRPDMAPYIFTEAILKGEGIKVFGDGKAMRDFTYIDDIVNGVILGLEKEFPFGIFNLGNSSPIDILSFIRIMEKKTNKKAIINFLPKISSEMKHTYANIKKAEKLLNYRPKIDIEEGLELFIKWFKKNRM